MQNKNATASRRSREHIFKCGLNFQPMSMPAVPIPSNLPALSSLFSPLIEEWHPPMVLLGWEVGQ